MVGGGKDGGQASIWNGRYSSSSSSKTLEAEDFFSVGKSEESSKKALQVPAPAKASLNNAQKRERGTSGKGKVKDQTRQKGEEKRDRKTPQ